VRGVGGPFAGDELNTMADRLKIIDWRVAETVDTGWRSYPRSWSPVFAYPRPQKIRDGRLEQRRQVAAKGRNPANAKKP
jgi:hypothetical protein